MDYIQQAYKSKYQFWKYLLIPGGFLGLMALNYFVIKFLNLDVDKLIQSEIRSKGKNRVLIEKLGPMIMVYYIGTGLMLGIMTLMDDGLELALGFHAANNLFTALLVTADWTAFQTHSILKDMSDPDKMGIMEIF